MVYSTCSLNPIENEAVVSAMLLSLSNRCLRLVDVSDHLPLLKRRAGLRSWRVWHRGQWHETWESMKERFPRKCPQMQTLFPPCREVVDEIHLERCVRLLPHDQDCGGFFIAVFEKVGEVEEGEGLLPEDEPEVVVGEGCAVLPDRLGAMSFEGNQTSKPASELSANVEGESGAGGDDGGGGAKKGEQTHGGSSEAVVEAVREIGLLMGERSAARSAGNVSLSEQLRGRLAAKVVSPPQAWINSDHASTIFLNHHPLPPAIPSRLAPLPTIAPPLVLGYHFEPFNLHTRSTVHPSLHV